MPLFPHTDPTLLPILEDLRCREPIFHRPEFPTIMAPDYWETGASGRRYTRDFILQHLAANPPVDAVTANWQTSDFTLQPLGPDTFLLTYTLQQDDRLTRRSTLWHRTPDGWQIRYHQGTIVTATKDDTTP
jgi:hypothetical protein